MAESDAYIRRISDKLQQLLKQFALLQQENGKMRQEMLELKKTVKAKDEQIQLLNMRVEVLKAIKTEMPEEEKKAFEKKISQYIKEIERCIALFSE